VVSPAWNWGKETAGSTAAAWSAAKYVFDAADRAELIVRSLYVFLEAKRRQEPFLLSASPTPCCRARLFKAAPMEDFAVGA